LDQFAPGYQFLNGGIEGDPYDNILRRAAAFNHDHAVALNIVMLGWHPWRLPSQPAERPGFLQRIGLRRPPTALTGMDDPDARRVHHDLRGELLAFLQSIPN